ncbi:MAG: class I SAM-dependent methyltransferase [Caulobacteraceae bacterium]
MNPSLEAQQSYWTEWNSEGREQKLSDISLDQRDAVIEWLEAIGRADLRIIDVGCGAGWLEPALAQFGDVTATDLCTSVLSRAQERNPSVRFVAGDFMTLDFGATEFDIVVALEVLSHVSDQTAFISKLASVLKPGGTAFIATQNRLVLLNHNNVPRRWVDRQEFLALLAARFEVQDLRVLTPAASKGAMRLVAGRRAKEMIRKIVGRTLERQLTAAGFGWTLMARVTKPSGH